MYRLQSIPDSEIILTSGSIVSPVATLRDEYGGVSHIIVDDHCYVLVNGTYEGGFATVKHWYREAVEALRMLPNPS